MILAVVGMKREARLLAQVGVRAVVGGGDAARLAATLEDLLSHPLIPAHAGTHTCFSPDAVEAEKTSMDPRARGDERGDEDGWTAVLSFGVAGGLDPSLKAGDVVVASGVWTPKQSPGSLGSPASPLSADPAWAARLLASIAGARSGLIVGQNTPAASVGDKFAIHAATGALAVDMESHITAEAAARHDLPFAAIRAISDPADHSLPPAAIAGFGADGGVDLAAVLRDLSRDPRQLPSLLRTGLEAEQAFTALRRAGPHIFG